MTYNQEINIPTCPICGIELPTKKMKEERNSGMYEYTVINRENLSLYHGRWVHDTCNPEVVFKNHYRKAQNGNA